MINFPPSWKIGPVKSLCETVVDCVNKTAPTVDHRTPFKMIRTTNVKNGRIDLTEARCVDEATFLKWNRRATPKLNDIVLTREAPLGDVGLIRTKEKVFLGQRTMLFRADSRKLNQNFLYYSLLGPTLQAQIKTFGSGSTVEHMRVPDAEKIDVPHPDLIAQRKIAAILTAYDDLIETNKRRISLLEKMAEEIYREWFVRMRFPGYRNTCFVKSVPEGWEVKRISELYQTASGGTPSRKNPGYFDGDIDWLKTGELKGIFTPNSEETISQSALENSAAKVFPVNTVIMAMYCAMPDISIAARECATNQACCAFLPKFDWLHYGFNFFLLRDAQKQLVMFAHGAAQQNLSQEIIRKFPILLPSKSLVEKFGDTVEPLLLMIRGVAGSIGTLTRTRDLLLPRLISGKLSVEDLDIQFPPSMEDAA